MVLELQGTEETLGGLLKCAFRGASHPEIPSDTTETYFTDHIINPFQVYNAMILVNLLSCMTIITN